MAIRILLVDGRLSVRQGLRLRLALEPDMRVVGEAADGLEALREVSRLSPDVVIMDVALPHMDGLAATATLSAFVPDTAVVILTLDDQPAVRARARAAGAAAFVPKQAGDRALLEAIRQVARAPKEAGS